MTVNQYWFSNRNSAYVKYSSDGGVQNGSQILLQIATFYYFALLLSILTLFHMKPNPTWCCRVNQCVDDVRNCWWTVQINEMTHSVSQSEASVTPALRWVIFSSSKWYWNQYWFCQFHCQLILIFAKQKESTLISRTPILMWLNINIAIRQY